jgi:hypothetical protein
METTVQADHYVSIFQLVGPAMVIVSLCAFVTLVVLLVVGLRSKAKGTGTASVVWWIRSVTLWMFVFGFVSFAAVATRDFAKIGMGGVGNPQPIFDTLSEAFSRLMLASGVALVGLTASLIVGPPKKMELR